MTANDIISASLRVIGAIAPGEVPAADETADAFSILNLMLDAWNAERLMVFTIIIYEDSLTVGKQTYTFGPGGDFNHPRPARIERAGIVSLANPAQPLELPLEMLTDFLWSQIPVKNILSALPLKVYNDGAYPMMNLNFWCIPSQTVNVRTYCWSLLSSFPDLVTDITFPPGYLEAIKYNLASRLAPEWGRPLMPDVAALAVAGFARIKSFNV
jgi:hypothetical protein